MNNKFIPLIIICFILLYEALTHPVRTAGVKCESQNLRNTELDLLKTSNAEHVSKRAELESQLNSLKTSNAEHESKRAELESQLNEFKTSNAEHESKRAELESQLNSLKPSETTNDIKVITFRWLFLSKKETYEKITDPFYDILLDDIKNSRYVSSYTHWGPGWPSYNTKIGSLENLKKRYGEPLPFDVVMPFGIENADVKQLTNYGIVSVMRKHECRVNEKCVGSFGNNQVIAMVNPFEIATNPDIDKASTSKLLVHVPSPASSVYFRPFQEPRTIDISILGSVNGAYPMRTRWRSLMPKLRARGWSISEQNMNHKYWAGRSEALKMRQKYRDLAKNSKVILTGASFVFYSLQKFSEFAAAGGLMISTLPQDRTDDFKKFIVEVNPKMSDNQLIEIVEKYLKNDADRMEKTKLGQDWWEKNGRPDNFFKTVNTAVVDYKAGAVGKRFDFPFFIRCRAAGGQKWCPNGKYTPMSQIAPPEAPKPTIVKPSTMPDYFTTPKSEPYCPAHRKASNRVAFIITNYNMPERTDQIVENIRKKVKWPVDIIVVDNGSDLQKQSKYTTLRLEKNVQTTNGWLVGLQYAKSLAAARKICYFAYWIWITTCLYDETQNDILTPLAQFLIDNPKAAGIGPALTKDSTTGWAHLKKVEGQSTPRKVKYADELGVLWRASFFDSIGWFDPDELRGFGVDIETGYLARYSGRDVYIHDGVMVKKHSGIAYKMKRMNANAGKRGQLAIAEMHMCLKRRYTDAYYGALRTENQPLSKGTYTDRLGTWFDDYSTYPTYVSDGLPNIAIVAPVQPAATACPKPSHTIMKEDVPSKFKEWTQDKLKFNYVNTYTSGVLDGDNLWLPQRNWVNVDEVGGRGDGIPIGRSKFRTSKDKSPSISYDVVWYLAGVRDNNIQMFTTETYLKWHYILKSNPQKEFTVVISGSRGGCGSTPSYVRDFCDTMAKGVGNAKCVAQEHAFSFKTMYVPGRIAVNYWPVLEEHRALFKPLIETFRKGLDIRQRESHPQVFLTRRDAKEGKARLMEKYNVFLSLLTSWTLLDGSSLTTTQKAAYLSDTGQFALEAGAGIANVLFLPDNAIVSILCPPSFQKVYHGMRMCETMAQHATLFNPNIKTRVLDVGTSIKSGATNANNQHYKLKDMKKVIGWLYISPLCPKNKCFKECNKWSVPPILPVRLQIPTLNENDLGFKDIIKRFKFNPDNTGDKRHGGSCTELRNIEKEVMTIISTFVSPNLNIIDGGAHFGETLSLMERIFPKNNHIYSIEAIKANCNKVKQVASSRTTVLNYALTEKKDVKEIFINCLHKNCEDEHSTLSDHINSWHLNERKKKTHKMKVNAMRLDEFIESLVQPVYYLKLDLEGMDFPILQTINLNIPIITWETTSNNCIDFPIQIEYFNQRGYEVFRLTPFGIIQLTPSYKSKGSCFTLMAIRKDIKSSLKAIRSSSEAHKDLQALSYQVKRGNYPPIPMVLETKPDTCDLFSKGWCEKFARNQQRLWEHDDPLLEIIRAKLNDCIEKTCYAIDIGGNIGTMSSIMLQQGAHVTTYEPQGDLATAIKNTVTLNHWNDRSVVYHNAVVASAADAGVTLNFGTRDASTRWGARPDGGHLRNIKAQSAITRQLSFPYKHYTFIKIDTDSDEDEKLTHFIIKKIQNGDITVDTMTCEATDTSSIVDMNNLDYSYSFIVNPYLKFKNKKQWFDRGILTKNEYLPLFDIQTSDEQIISELLADIIKEADIVFQKRYQDLQALSYQVKRGNYPPIPMVLETKPGTCDLFSKGWCEKFARNDYTNAGTDMPLIDIVVHYLKGCHQKTCYAIDIGSNLGYISSFMLQQGAQVTSYEPQGDFATALKNTVILNHWNDRSVVNHNAVVATPEEAGVTLNFGTRDASTKWGWRPDGGHIKNIKSQSAQTILLTFPHKHYAFIKIDTDSVDISLLQKTIDHIKNGLQVDALTSEEVSGAEAYDMQQLGYKASLLITTHLHLKNSKKWLKTTITKRESLPLYDVIQLTASEWNRLFKDIRVVNIVFEKSK